MMKMIILENIKNSSNMSRNSIEGYSTILKVIEESDSQLICDLRNNPNINKFLSNSTSITVLEQKEWLKNNLKANDGIYFKIIDKNKNNFVGTISLYNVNNSTAEFGRYICLSPIQAIEAELLILKYGFEIMKLKQIYCKTAEENTKVWKQHFKYGFKDTSREYFKHKEMYLKVQEISYNDYINFDFTKINKLIATLNKQYSNS